jgi:hypothetical protein
MPEYFGQYILHNNDHFNTRIVHTLAGHCARLPQQSVLRSYTSGQSKLNTARCTHLYRIAFIRINNTRKLTILRYFIRT